MYLKQAQNRNLHQLLVFFSCKIWGY